MSCNAIEGKNHIQVRMWFSMVEARGFKHLSEDYAIRASTGYSHSFDVS